MSVLCTLLFSPMESCAVTSQSPPWWQILVIGRHPTHTLWRIFVLVVACFVVFKFVLLPVRVEGGSMLPTYQDHRVNFINRLAYVRSEPKRGDVVGIQLAGHSVMFLKRIIAEPGETIGFHLGHAIVNGEVLDEPYIRLPCHWERAPVRLAPDEYFVVGDNRSMDIEDHTF